MEQEERQNDRERLTREKMFQAASLAKYTDVNIDRGQGIKSCNRAVTQCCLLVSSRFICLMSVSSTIEWRMTIVEVSLWRKTSMNSAWTLNSWHRQASEWRTLERG